MRSILHDSDRSARRDSEREPTVGRPRRIPIDIHEIVWLTADEAIVTWSFADGAHIAVAVTVEFEPRDRSVGIDESYWHAHGDAPKPVLDRIAEEASLRAVESYEERDDSDRDDGYRHSDHDGGGL